MKRVFELRLADGSVAATGDYQKCTMEARRRFPDAVSDWNRMENAVYMFDDKHRAVCAIQVAPQEVRYDASRP